MYRQPVSFRFGGPITKVVRDLMIINGAIFLIQKAMVLMAPGVMESIFGLNHQGLVIEFKVWQIFTYMFLHGGWLHIIFNLLALWIFAGDLENLWGSKQFLKFYLFCGTGAGIFIAVMNFIVYSKYGSHPAFPYSPTTIGASGAIYGLLLAYGLTWPNREVLLYFLFPVKMKYLVILFGLIEFFGTLSSVSGSGGNISHIGHLGGLITGLVLIYYWKKSGGKSREKPGSQKSGIGQFFKKRRLKKKQQEIDKRIEAKKIIDDLLEKIARSGMSSLSPDEKKKLEWARKHYYPENDETFH